MRFLLMVLLLLGIGCSGKNVKVKAGQSSPGISPITTNSPEYGMPVQKSYYGTAANCPACGKEINVTPYTPYEQCGSSTTFFCCPTCKEKSNKQTAPGNK